MIADVFEVSLFRGYDPSALALDFEGGGPILAKAPLHNYRSTVFVGHVSTLALVFDLNRNDGFILTFSNEAFKTLASICRRSLSTKTQRQSGEDGALPTAVLSAYKVD